MIRPSTRQLQAVAGAAFILAAAVVVVPLPAWLGRRLTVLASARWLVATLALAGGLLAVVTVVRSGSGSGTGRRRSRTTGLAGAGVSPGNPDQVVGGDIEAALTRLARVSRAEWEENDDRLLVRDRAEATAVTVLAATEGYSETEAEERVRDGSWTDDPRAAAFLGGATVPKPPLWMRIVDWLHGDPYRRQARAAVAEIAERASHATEVTRP